MAAEWPAIMEELLKEYPKLKRSDLFYERGNEEQVIRMIQLRLYKSKRDVIDLIASK